MTIISLPIPGLFEVDNESSAANNERWSGWLRRFNRWVSAMKLDSDTQILNTMLTAAGEGIEEIYSVSAEATDKYADVCKVIAEHFKPYEDVETQTVKFRQLHQRSNETIEAFMVRLKTAAVSCKFTDLNTQLKLQIIMGTNSKRVKTKGMQESTALSDLVKYARALEASNTNVIDVATDKDTISIKQESLNQVSNYKPFKSNKFGDTCKACGFNLPHRGSSCPALGKNCHNCGGIDHFSKKCVNPKKFNKPNNKLNAIRSTSCVNNREESDDSSDEYTLFSCQSKNNNRCPSIMVKLQSDHSINNLIFGVDSQASLNAISLKEYNDMHNKPKLIETRTKAFSYDGKTPIKVKGKFYATVTALNKSVKAWFTVFENGNGNLLSCQTSLDLGLISLNIPNQLFSIENKECLDSKIEPEEVNQTIYEKNLMLKFPEVFTGNVGRLKDFELELHIDPNITPTQAAKRPIPIHYKQQVIEELNKMLKDGVIERVEGYPTGWLSELVIVPKPHKPGEIRLVVDAREANMAILRERHNTPTPEDLMFELNGASRISKLDFQGGFGQVAIHPNSRHITVFRTPLGLMRYCTLVQGICCATEMFQHVIKSKLEGLKGVRNMIDDIFVWGRNQVEHDSNLLELLVRLAALGLTCNIKKCEFNRTSMEFFGIQFSDGGVSITKEKQKALLEASVPETKSELRSYLGLASFCGRSIYNLAGVSGHLWNLTNKGVNWSW